MLNTTAIDIEQAEYDAIHDTQKHLRRHGGSLSDLLGAIDERDESGVFDAFCDLVAVLGTQFPDAGKVEVALRKIEQVLASQSQASLDQLGREKKRQLAEATRWHGARVSELLGRFSVTG